MASTREIYDYGDYEEVTDGDDIRRTPSSAIDLRPRRYDYEDDRSDYTTYRKSTNPPIQRRASVAEQDTRPRRSTQTQSQRPQPKREPGPRYLPNERYDEVQEQLRTRRQPQRRQHTTQPRVQRVTTGPVVNRRGALRVIGYGAVGAAFVGVGNLPHLVEQQDLDNNHFHQGDIPNRSIMQAVGHNGDSVANPTIMNFRVAGKELVFEEIPAGDKSKAKLTSITTLTALKYNGPVADLFLSITPMLVGTRYQIDLAVWWYASTWVIFYQKTDPAVTVLADLGHGYFEAPSSK